jgi:putative ABC transport system substrate-binding protein
MKRREFIAGLGSAVVWPLVARAQQGERVRRIGVFVGFVENDPEGQLRYSVFTQARADLGWTDGRNVQMDFRWAGSDINRIGALVHELVGLQPDIIVANNTPMTVALQRETRTIPIVFAGVGDPVASGLVARLDRPSGNITGFALHETPLAGKWLWAKSVRTNLQNVYPSGAGKIPTSSSPLRLLLNPIWIVRTTVYVVLGSRSKYVPAMAAACAKVSDLITSPSFSPKLVPAWRKKSTRWMRYRGLSCCP